MKDQQLNSTNAINLEDYNLMCECAETIAKFAILCDFMKKGVSDFYSFKSKKEELSESEAKVLSDKAFQMQRFCEQLTTKN